MVTGEIASLDLAGSVAYGFPKEWYGFWVEKLKDRIVVPGNLGQLRPKVR